jgi:hypothetical protein
MISDEIKSNPNRLWSFIKSKRCDSTGVAPFTKGGSLEKANIFKLTSIKVFTASNISDFKLIISTFFQR